MLSGLQFFALFHESFFQGGVLKPYLLLKVSNLRVYIKRLKYSILITAQTITSLSIKIKWFLNKMNAGTAKNASYP